ncbi:monoamine oxidase [Leptodontidium sp. MPI-SDFR-AT-0119]|nr:monoamine oxidase [Leptodontidium sp. MPI-SDFR-AT-0119]
MSDIYDTIIIGAGLSGLQAALSLHTANRSILIFEARSRIGGKTNSIERPDGRGIQELGAAWLNDTNQSHVWEYVQKFGLTPVVQNIEGLVAAEDVKGKCHLFPFGEFPRFGEDVTRDIAMLRDEVERASLDPETFEKPKCDELNTISLEQYCKDLGAGPEALLTARVWSRGTLGQDPCDVSALAYLEICRGGLGLVNLRYDGKDGAQYLRLQEGTQSIAIGISTLLPKDAIKLNTAVSSIIKKRSKLYTATTSQGEIFSSRKVIISIPSPAYKNITFDPPLPTPKFIYTTSVHYGTFVKFICLFKTPFWKQRGACGLAQSFRGPMNHCRDTSVPDLENFALTCFLCAEPGRKWLALDNNERTEVVLRQLCSLFGVGYDVVKVDFIDSITSEWTEDAWAGWGCPFATRPPGLEVSVEMASKKHDGLYFVGTEFADEWRGYMEGALRSGKEGAIQVLADFKEEES